MTLDLRRATDLPEKLTFKTMVRYEWIDEENKVFESKHVERKKDPDFQYKAEHILLVTEDLINYLKYNTLTVKVMGMIESKIIKKKPQNRSVVQSDYQSDAPQDVSQAMQSKLGANATPDERIKELERMNMELMKQVEAERKRAAKAIAQPDVVGGKPGTSCCTLF